MPADKMLKNFFYNYYLKQIIFYFKLAYNKPACIGNYKNLGGKKNDKDNNFITIIRKGS